MNTPLDRPTWPRVSPCLHCGVPVLRDNDGTPIHASLSYVCRDRWGQIISTTATPAGVPTSPRNG